MSLIVAKQEGNNINIVSDTMLTNPDNLNKIELSAPEEFSAIKIVIINPFISIAFAGDVFHAKEAIAICRKLDTDIGKIIDHLLEVNTKSKNQTEFIVCINLPPFFIYEIKNSKKIKTTSTWIGNHDGFNVFQKHFLTSAKESLLLKMENALNSVIQSNVKGVNGFLVTVDNNKGYFSYNKYVNTYMPPRTYIGNSIIEVYGTVHEGGYTINLFGDEKGDVLALHLRQNRYGLVYLNKDNGYLQPVVYKDVDEHEFNEITEMNYGIKPPFLMSPKQNSYFERGNKAAKKKQFETAIAFYNLGLKENEKTLIASLHSNKGICEFHLGQLKESALSFHHSVKADHSFQQKVLSFTNQFRKKK